MTITMDSVGKRHHVTRSGETVRVDDTLGPSREIDTLTLAAAASQDDADLAAVYYAIYQAAGGTRTQAQLGRWVRANELMQEWSEATTPVATTSFQPKLDKRLRGNAIGNVGAAIQRDLAEPGEYHAHPRAILNRVLKQCHPW